MPRSPGERRIAGRPGESADRAARSRRISPPPQWLQKILGNYIHPRPGGRMFASSRSTRGVWPRETTWDRDRRPRVCLASMHSGRSGPRLGSLRKSRREELADGEVITSDCLTKSAARSAKSPDGAPRGAASRGIEARTRPTLCRTALRPPHFCDGKPSSLGAETARENIPSSPAMTKKERAASAPRHPLPVNGDREKYNGGRIIPADRVRDRLE
jgi:hypothetical protein